MSNQSIKTDYLKIFKCYKLCHFTANPITAHAKIYANAIEEENKSISNLHQVYGM